MRVPLDERYGLATTLKPLCQAFERIHGSHRLGNRTTPIRSSL